MIGMAVHALCNKNRLHSLNKVKYLKQIKGAGYERLSEDILNYFKKNDKMNVYLHVLKYIDMIFIISHFGKILGE